MSISKNVHKMIGSSSFIRMMFETGAKLKKEFGQENVFDLSLGNPVTPPPSEFTKVLLEKAEDNLSHRYMPNSGYMETRNSIAEYVSKEQKITLSEKSIVMTCGAGGALNVILKTLLNPGDKVIASTPCFMEYKFYCNNHGGELELVEGLDDFNIDVRKIEESITSQTAAVIINSPNNPSGRIYPESTIAELCSMLKRKSDEVGRCIYLISDEPYRKIVFDGIIVPPILSQYNNSIICTSYSKDLSLPGERIGYIALCPKADDFHNLVSGFSLCNRVLGYVNAPSLMQRVVSELQGVSVDIDMYRKKRDYFCNELYEMGFNFRKPEGTFYIFVEAPDGDDLKIAEMLLSERVLVVPGRGFSKPGYFRIAFCVEDSVIEGAIKGFRLVSEKLNLKSRSYHVQSSCS